METHAYFKVPFADKESAKALGARFDVEAKCWYAPDAEVAQRLGERFPPIATPHPITELPGEDREFGGSKLFVDLVPASCWFTNVRYCIDPDDWERLGKGIRARAGQVCEVCNGAADPDNGVLLEAHERWHFDDDTGVQTLKRIICLCTACHRTTHYGLSQLRGEELQVRVHFMAVNECEEPDLDRHVFQAFETWKERSSREWTLDLSIIENAGIRLKRPVEAKDRRGVVADEIRAARRLENHANDVAQHGGLTMREITRVDDLDDLFRGL